MKHPFCFSIALLLLMTASCAQDQPFLSGHIKRAHDAIMVTCDPYNKGIHHTCLVFSSAFRESLYIYDATAGEMVLSPMVYFPLKVKVGQATDLLVAVVSDDPFPLMFAIDKAEPSLLVTRLFPSVDKNQRSFETPKKYRLDKAPYHMAAALIDDTLIAMMTFPEDGLIKVLALNKDTGEPDLASVKSIPLGTNPHHVVIDEKKMKAVISDSGEHTIRAIDLANIVDVVQKGAALALDPIPIGSESEELLISRRDFGDGEHLYAVVFKHGKQEVKLVNIDSKNYENLALQEEPMAAYFPDKNSDSCCKGTKQWFSVATIKGNQNYISVTASGGTLKLEKTATLDLTSEQNLALGKVHIKKILGGAILQDKTIKRESPCKSHRQTFYIASYGNRRSYLNSEPFEAEAHGYSCEGEESASRFGGFKTK